MKKIWLFEKRGSILIPFLALLLLVITTCEDEQPVPREYPRLSGTIVSNVTDSGAVFSADLYSLGNENIIQYGFIWSMFDGSLSNSERVYLGVPGQPGIFSASITTTLKDGTKYIVKPFVETEKRIVYGPVTTFMSMGSKGPSITDFSPVSAGWGDTIRIYGRNFSFLYNKVLLNNTLCPMVRANDTVICALVSHYLITDENILSVEVSNTRATMLQKKFILIRPTIKDFYPKQAHWGDTITIKGKYLSTVSNTGNTVKLGNINCTIIETKDTLVRIVVDYKVNVISNPVSLNLNGITITGTEPVTLILPSITDYSPKQARWGDTISIKGKYLSVAAINQNYVSLGNIKCPIIHSKDTLLKITVDPNITTINNTLSLSLNGLTVTGTEPVTLMPPPAFTFSPSEGTWNSLVTLNGRFNTIASKNTVYFNSAAATIQSVSATSLKVKVPTSLRDSLSVVKYNAGPFSIISESKFRLLAPVIKSFNPSIGAGGTQVTIRGKYFLSGYGGSIVKFGNSEATINSANDSILVVTVPNNISGSVKISVTVGSQKAISVNEFTIKNPVITSISPQTGTFNNEITIIGDNFIPSTGTTTVLFGTNQATIVSATQNQIIARVPVSIDSIPVNIRVNAGINYSNSLVKFTLEPHTVSSASGAYSPTGELRIPGNNFNPEASRNTVYWGSYKLKVKSATPTEIVAEWGSLPNGTNKILVQTGGYKRYSNESFSVSSAWTRIQSPEIATNNSTRNIGASIQNYGYVLSSAMNATYRFNPADQSWTNLGISYPLGYSTGSASTVLNNVMYIVGGFYNGGYLHAFDPNTNLWKAYTNFGTIYEGVCFGLNNRLWFGLRNGYTAVNQFYEIDPGNNFSVIRRGDFPTPVPGGFASYFTVSNKGYVVFSNNQVWQFNPDNLTWQRKNNFPGKGRSRAVSFIIDEDAYFGLGYSTTSLDDIWKYDHLTDTWSPITRMPRARYWATAFTINNKVYLGFGLDNNTSGSSYSLFDFYEFDPSY